jgi:hypothetical protein
LYEFHVRHGVDCAALLTTAAGRRLGGARGSWRPFLAHLGSDMQRRKSIKLKSRRKLPKTLAVGQIETVLRSCERLWDRFLISLLAGTASGLITPRPRRWVGEGPSETVPGGATLSAAPSEQALRIFLEVFRGR